MYKLQAISAVKKAFCGRFGEYEIIIFNDCSSDKTGEVAHSLSEADNNIKVIHNEKNMGFGYNYRTGVGLASKEYIAMVPGDNEIEYESVKNIFSLVGKADMVLPYHANPGVRPLGRRLMSCFFTRFMNLIFGLNIRYYNGPVVHRADLVKNVKMTTDGFAFQAEIITRLLKSGNSYVETGMKIKKRTYGRFKIFKIKNVASVISTISRLWYEINIKR